MQSIAEEVVSSSGGGGTYITSGFSNYVGHSAIGLCTLKLENARISGGDFVAIGRVRYLSKRDVYTNIYYLDGPILVSGGDVLDSYNGVFQASLNNRTTTGYAIVF